MAHADSSRPQEQTRFDDHLPARGARPVVAVVQVQGFRAGAPWPVATLEIREDGSVSLRGDADAAYGHLINATVHAGQVMVKVNMLAHLEKAGLVAPAPGTEGGPLE